MRRRGAVTGTARAAAACVVAATALGAPPLPPLAWAEPDSASRPLRARLERPVGVEPLSAFHAALRRTERGEAKTRVLFFGDSHTAADFMTARLRARLQERFGNGGPGFLLPAKPWPSYRHDGLWTLKTRGFRAHTLRVGRSDGRTEPLGLMGVALDNRRSAARAALEFRGPALPATRPYQVQLFYLRQPGGGRLRLWAKDAQRKLSTDGPAAATGTATLRSSAGTLVLRAAAGAPVTLFGLAVESTQPALVLDTLGIPGAQARVQLAWDRALFVEQVRLREPSLWVLSYGTNEAAETGPPLDAYERRLRRVVQRLHEAAPQASCLLLGPTDRVEREAGGYRQKERVAPIIAAQRRVAFDAGCGFIDLVALTGGPGSLARWRERAPDHVRHDLVHLTAAGYRVLGDALYRALLAGYGPQG